MDINMNLQIAACLPAWLRDCLMISNDCTRDRIAIKYRIFGFKVWRATGAEVTNVSSRRLNVSIRYFYFACRRSTDLNDRNVHEISICSNVIFEHNLSIDEWARERKRETACVFAIDLTSQEVSLCIFFCVSIWIWTTAKAVGQRKKWSNSTAKNFYFFVFFYFFLREKLFTRKL